MSTDTKKRILNNTLVQFFSYGIGLLISLTTTMILSRHLGVEGFGQFNYIIAFYYLFISLNDFGLNSIIIREVSQDPKRGGEILGSVFCLKLLIGFFSLILAWYSIARLSAAPDLKNALRLYSFVLPLLALQVPSLIFNTELKLSYPSFLSIVSKTIGFALTLAVVYFKGGLFSLIAVCLLQEALAAVMVFIASTKYVRLEFKWNFHLWKKMLRSSLILGLSGLFAAAINRMDFLMLERMRGLQEVGLYAANYKITNLLEAFPLMLMNSLYPLMSRYVNSDIKKLERLYIQSSIVLQLCGLLVGVLITLYAEPLVLLVCGHNFTEAASGLRLLVWSTVFLYGALTGGNLLISWHKEIYSLFMTALMAALNFALNLVLIPKYGFTGAAAATTVSFFGLWFFVAFFVNREFRRHRLQHA